MKIYLNCLFVYLRMYMFFSHKLANGKIRRVMSREEFRLLHYAGEVNYNVNGKHFTIFMPPPLPWVKPHSLVRGNINFRACHTTR